MVALALITACAPTVAPSTVERVIQVESKGDPLALNVNGATLRRKPRNAAEAAEFARAYIKAGYTVDMGLMQVNSSNLKRLGYTVADMFEPCKNLAAGAKVLTDFYVSATDHYTEPQAALRAALSAYNTGSFRRGFANGYVSRYLKGPVTVSFTNASAAPTGGPVRLTRTPPPETRPAAPPQPLNPYTAPTTVYVRQEDTAMQRETTKPVISTNEADSLTPGVQVEQTAQQAEDNGAFEETAMSEADAWESNSDLAPADDDTAVVQQGQVVASAQE